MKNNTIELWHAEAELYGHYRSHFFSKATKINDRYSESLYKKK